MNAFVLTFATILIGFSCTITTTSASERDSNKWLIDQFDDKFPSSEENSIEQKIRIRARGAYFSDIEIKTYCYNVKIENKPRIDKIITAMAFAINENKNMYTMISRPDWTCRTYLKNKVWGGPDRKYKLDQCESATVTVNGSVFDPGADITYSLCEEHSVALYEHHSYKGTKAYFIEGDYTIDGIEALGLKNDQVSSIKVPPGYEVEIFEHNDYHGDSEIIREDTGSFSSIGFNDKISSVKVRKLSDFVGVGLYAKCDYYGIGRDFEEGEYLTNDIEALGLKNDQISSIKVPPGYQVQIFEHDNYHGNSKIITEDISCLTSIDFNDKIGSVKVKKIVVRVKLSCSDNDTSVVDLEPGSYNFAKLEANVDEDSIQDNSISSIEIGEGFKVTLYSDGSYKGKSKVLEHTNNAQCLTSLQWYDDRADVGWNNKVSSLVITQVVFNKQWLAVDIPKTFADAQAHCETIGTTLAAPKNEDENTFMQSVFPTKSIWFGYRCAAMDCSSKSTWNLSYENFNSGQPNCNRCGSATSLVGVCTGSHSKSAATWNDNDCGEKKRFLCQK